ncbi:hypothetical protein HRG_011487 [Hirsutella rhossiliensis]|uniref:Uncharacterized protein n=1 Tax=Hirsutella rhossiliensis TaxID=111463 RepID=A0A9P8MLI4_9HYPO|nr:uncharacterized protein HRG_11487 [Hirsutella rhossiliensis]KAH0957340.1 hypothetical protein HRG_11487 [Hirsutella rhossiliensis]
MFCTSLRKRREWAPAVAQLTTRSWTETKLETHDVGFLTRLHQGRDRCFRLLLFSAAQVGTSQANERIERLPLLDGGGKTAIVFLVASQDDMAAFMTLQMQMLPSRDNCIPLIPVSSAAELPSCLESLRRQCAAAADAQQAHEQAATSTQRHLLAHCTGVGAPLGEGQTNVLSDICTGFGHLAQHALDPDGQDELCYFLGHADGQRVTAFLTAGPVARLG